MGCQGIDRFDSSCDGYQGHEEFHCTMNAPAVDWALRSINGTSTLETWCLGLQANVYDGTGTGAKNNSGSFLEQYLNSMVMVAGGNGYLLATPPSTGNGGGDTQGCLAQRTSVPLEIIILFAVITIGVLGMAIYLCSLSGYWLPSANAWQPVNAKDNDPPNGLLGWMDQAVKEHFMVEGETIITNRLKLCSFGRKADGSVGIQLAEQEAF